jgi:hypothetical protein
VWLEHLMHYQDQDRLCLRGKIGLVGGLLIGLEMALALP